MKSYNIILLFLFMLIITPVTAGTSIFYLNSTSQGGIYSVATDEPWDVPWAQLRNGIGSLVTVGGYTANTYKYLSLYDVAASGNSSLWYENDRGVFRFDTSAINDASIIQSAKIGIYYYDVNSSMGNTSLAFLKFTGTGINTASYNSNGTSLLTDTIYVTSLTTAKYYNISLNSLGLSNISKTGMTEYLIKSGWDYSNTSPTWAAWADNYVSIRTSAYGKAPYLEVITIDPPVASFTPSSVTDYPDRAVYFASTSTGGGNMTYNWTFTHTSGNNTPIIFSTDDDPYYIFGDGNWKITLTVSNNAGSNTSPPIWINLSKCNSGGINCSYRAYIHNYTDEYGTANNGPWPVTTAVDWWVLHDTGTYNEWWYGEDDYYISPWIISNTSTNKWEYNARPVANFNTSVLPDNAIVTSGRIGFYHYSYDGAFTCFTNIKNISLYNFKGNFTAVDDVLNYDKDQLANNISLSSMTTTKYYNFTLNTLGISNISKTGRTKYMILFDVDAQNITPTWVSNGEAWVGLDSPYGAPSHYPFMEISYNESPISAFSPNTSIESYPDYLVMFTDLTTGGGIKTYNWSFNNVTGNNTWVTFSQSANPTIVFTEGNWSIRLNVSNEIGSNLSSQNTWINLSKCNGIICNIRLYPVVDMNGSVLRGVHNATFQDLHDGAGTNGDSGYAVTSAITTDITTNRFYRIHRGVTVFNGSNIPDSAVIANANLSLKPTAIYNTTIADSGVNIRKFTIDGTLNLADYDNFGTDLFSTYRNVSTLSTSSTYKWELNSLGLSNISKNSTFGIGIVNQYDFENITPPWGGSSTSYYIGADFNNRTGSNFISIMYLIPPNTSFTSNITTGLQPATIAFTDTSTDSPTSWNWSFGDGYVSSEQNPVHTYYSGGNFTVNLTASNIAGSTTKLAYIEIWNRTTSAFTGTPVSGIAPFSVQFTGIAGNGTTYYWIFGDGNTTNNDLLSPEHTYNTVGIYSVNFSVNNGHHINWTNRSLYITSNLSAQGKIANKMEDTQNVLFIGVAIGVIGIVGSAIVFTLFGRR